MAKELIEEFAKSAERLLPLMQQYEMRMSGIGLAVSVALIILVLLGGIAFILIGKPDDPGFVVTGLVMLEMVLAFMAVIFAANYLGWKYHPEMKFLRTIWR